MPPQTPTQNHEQDTSSNVQGRAQQPKSQPIQRPTPRPMQSRSQHTPQRVQGHAQTPSAKMDELLLRDPTDYKATRKAFFNAVENSFKKMPSVSNSKHTLRVSDVSWKDDPSYNSKDITNALRKQKTLHRTLKGRYELVDNETGEVVSKTSPRALMHAPYFTDDGTFVLQGSEMQVINQARSLPGVYTKVKDNGIPTTQISAGRGGGFRLIMDPEKGQLKFKIGSRHMPAYNVFKALGVPEDRIKQTFGKLYEPNKNHNSLGSFAKWHQQAVEEGKKYMSKGFWEPTPEEKESLTDDQIALRAWFGYRTLDPKTTEGTLNKPFDKVTPEVLEHAVRNIQDVYRGSRSPDNMDSLQYQSVWSAPDRIAEMIQKDNNGQMRQLLWKSSRKEDLKNIPTAAFNTYVADLFNNSGNGQVLEQNNPMDMFNRATQLTWLGEGGLPTTDAAPMSARGVQPSYYGFVDMVRTPESLRVGLDMHLARNVKLGPDKKLYSQFIDPKTGENNWVDMHSAAKGVIAYPSYYTSEKNEKYVQAIDGDEIKIVPRESVDYVLPSPDDANNALMDTIPIKSGVKGMRQLMGSKFATHAMPLQHPDVPLVQTKDNKYGTTLKRLGQQAGIRKSPVKGTVSDISKDGITITDKSGKKHEVDLYNERPFARMTVMNSRPVVKVGDTVDEDSLVAATNYTNDKGELAMMKNMSVAWMPYEGYSHEDGIPISESAAEKLKSNTLSTPKYDVDDKNKLSKKTFFQKFPAKFSQEQLKTIDDKGVVKPGTVLNYGDPIYLGYRTRESDRSTLGKPLITDASKTWDKQYPGRVIRSSEHDDGMMVDIMSESKVKTGDKIALNFGAKGVNSTIIPDDQMPTGPDGKPLDVLLHPLSIASRVNPSQLAVAGLGRVAQKTGKPYVLEGTDETEAMYKKAIDELQKNGFNLQEDIYDPKTGRTVHDVSMGVLPVYRMGQTADKGGKSRSIGSYTSEGTPLRSGDESAKHLGFAEISALRGHGADKVLADMKLIHSQQNTDFWSKLRNGQTPSVPKTPAIYTKFRDLIKGSGVNLNEGSDGDSIFAMTGDQVDKLVGNREVRNAETYDLQMRPISGGLMDPDLTGDNFGYVKLPEPMLNPIMETPMRVILDVTGPQLSEMVKNGELSDRLSKINVDREMRTTKDMMRSSSEAKRNQAYRKYAYLNAMKENNTHPKDFMVDKWPVIPSAHRPITEMGDTHLVSDPNRLYRELLLKSEEHKDMKKLLPTRAGTTRESVYDALKAVVGTGTTQNPKLQKANVQGVLQQFLGKGSPKLSPVQRRVIGGDMDLYGLGVIAPDPKLELDDIGVPEDQAWKIFEPFIVRDLVKKGLQPRRAVQEVQEKSGKAKNSLHSVSKERPVIVNRAPTLHKYSMQAFNANIVPGKAIRINPLVCEGYNADFDGDKMSVTVPVTKAAVDEAYEKMLPSKNLLNVQGDAAYTPQQELLMGMYLLTKDPSKNKKALDAAGATDPSKIRENYSQDKIDIDTPVLGYSGRGSGKVN